MAPIPAADLVRHAGFVRALAYSLVRDEQEAEDVAQEALATAWERPPRDARRLRGWLRTVARNLAWRSVRARVRRARRERAAARPEAASFDTARDALLEAVVDEVCALDEPARSIVVWRYYEGLSSARIGERLSMPAPTVRGRLRAALRMLRRRLDERHDGGRRAWSASLIALCGLEPRRVAARAGAVAVAALVAGGAFVAWLAWPAAPPDRSRAVARRADPAAVARSSAEAPRDGAVPAAGSAAQPPDRDHDLFGKVVDGAGRPVPGARVRACYLPLCRTELGLANAFEEVEGPGTTTADDGAFRLRLGWGDLVQVHADAPGHAARVVPMRQAGERVRIVLAPPVTLRVRVHDGSRALGDATLELRSVDRDGDRFRYRRTATTASDGVAVFAGLPGPDFARLFCTHPRYVKRGRPSADVHVPESGALAIDVEMIEGRPIRGQVVDPEDRAIEGATVSAPWSAAATTRADGSFVIHVAPAPAPMLDAQTPGLAPAKVRGDFERPVRVVLGPGDTATGRLVTRAGAPVAGARVAVTGFGAYGMLAPQETRTDPAGAFRFDGLARAIPVHTLVVLAEGYGREIRDVPRAPGGPGAIELGEIVVQRAGGVDGRVVDDAGRPRVNVRVHLVGPTGGRAPHGAGLFGAIEKRYTDDLGRFRFPGLAPGTYELSTRTGPRATTRVASGEVARVELDEAARRTLRVVVTDATGTPIGGARVRAGSARADTDAHGAATVTVYGDRPEVVAITRDGYGRATAGADTEEIAIVIEESR